MVETGYFQLVDQQTLVWIDIWDGDIPIGDEDVDGVDNWEFVQMLLQNSWDSVDFLFVVERNSRHPSDLKRNMQEWLEFQKVPRCDKNQRCDNAKMSNIFIDGRILFQIDTCLSSIQLLHFTHVNG